MVERVPPAGRRNVQRLASLQVDPRNQNMYMDRSIVLGMLNGGPAVAA
jgi:hypothetical protein